MGNVHHFHVAAPKARGLGSMFGIPAGKRASKEVVFYKEDKCPLDAPRAVDSCFPSTARRLLAHVHKLVALTVPPGAHSLCCRTRLCCGCTREPHTEGERHGSPTKPRMGSGREDSRPHGFGGLSPKGRRQFREIEPDAVFLPSPAIRARRSELQWLATKRRVPNCRWRTWPEADPCVGRGRS